MEMKVLERGIQQEGERGWGEGKREKKKSKKIGSH